MRSEPLEQRKAALAKLLRRAKPGIRLSEHLTGPGHTIFEHACKLGLEGIVSKRLSSSYRSGKAKCWIKVKGARDAADCRGRMVMTNRATLVPDHPADTIQALAKTEKKAEGDFITQSKTVREVRRQFLVRRLQVKLTTTAEGIPEKIQILNQYRLDY